MKIVRSNDIPWANQLVRGPYENRRKELGAGKLAVGMWELAPGKKSFPLHKHNVTEEALYVLSGRAQVRTTEGTTAIGPGDFVSFPAGGVAHQLINDGPEPLVYLAMSTNPAGADVVEYPDSGKVACSIGTFPTGRRFVFREKEQADYFEGEL